MNFGGGGYGERLTKSIKKIVLVDEANE